MDREDFDLLSYLFFMLLTVIVLTFGVVSIVNRITFQADRVKIEQLRIDVKEADTKASEDILGQATQWNQTIVANKRYNKIFIIRFAIPDGWDEIKTIEIPK